MIHRIETVFDDEKDALPIDVEDPKKRADLVLAMTQLARSPAWAYVKTYLALDVSAIDQQLDTIGNQGEMLRLMGRRYQCKKVMQMPDLFLALAAAKAKQQEAERVRAEKQPEHSMAPNFGPKKKTKARK